MSQPDAAPFTAHCLHFEIQAREPMLLHAYMGSALRGMFYRAMLALSGLVRDPATGELQFLPNDPVQYLLSSLDEENERGRDIPRPYTIEPPTDAKMGTGTERVLQPGERFSFGMTLYARAMEIFPYVILAMKQAEEMGIGRRLSAPGERLERGRFNLAHVWCSNPFTGERQEVYAGGQDLVSVPDLGMTHEQVLSAPCPQGRTLALEFLTPVTLRANQQPVTTPQFNVLIHRLLERLSGISTHFASAPLACLPTDRMAKIALLQQADAVHLTYDGTHWISLNGYSARQRKPTALSGFAGVAIYDVPDLASFWPLLRWGQIIHAGKHAVKGNGMFRIVSA
jgi:hypothetical protein